MRLSEAVDLALSYRDKFTNLDDNIYIYRPVYHSYQGVYTTLSITWSINPVSFELFRFNSYNEAYSKPRDWNDIEQ